MARPSSGGSASSSELSVTLPPEFTVEKAEARLQEFKRIYHGDKDSVIPFRLFSTLLDYAPPAGKLYIANEICRPPPDPTWDIRETLYRRSQYFLINLLEAFQGKTRVRQTERDNSLYDSGSTPLSERYTPEGAKRNQKSLQGLLLTRDGYRDKLCGWYHQDTPKEYLEPPLRLDSRIHVRADLEVAHIITFHYNQVKDSSTESNPPLLLEKGNGQKSLKDDNIDKDNTKQTRKRRKASLEDILEDDEEDENAPIGPIPTEALTAARPSTAPKKQYYWHALSLFLGSRKVMKLVKGAKINDPLNALLLELQLHRAFDCLNVCLEPIPVVALWSSRLIQDVMTENHKYKVHWIDLSRQLPHCPHGKEVDFTPMDPSISAPSRYLLWVHYLLAQVYHGSGAAEYFKALEDSFHEHGVLEDENISKLLTILDHLAKSRGLPNAESDFLFID